ncbi:MAG: hypothetical protein EBU66_04145 [Bacteroidetes bacterium]|nr:hypothetical protein [bacterium]NBP63858.1 hypothetical protein [Bacteroidota bacterium]
MITISDDFYPLFGGLLLSFTLTGCGGDTAQTPIVTIAPTPIAIVAPTPAPVVNTTATLTTNLTVRQNGVDYYQFGPYIVLNNNWGADRFGLVYGKDYNQTVTYDKFALPKGTHLVWDYPDTPHGDGSIIYGFPSVAFGKTTLGLTGYNIDNSLTQVKYIKDWDQSYDVTLSGDLKYMNLMSNMFFFDSNGEVAGEIMFSTYLDDHMRYWSSPNNFFGQQPNAHTHEIVMDGVKWDILVSTDYKSDKKNYYVTPDDPYANITHGNIDWDKLIDLLEEHGDINPDWYVKGVELGVEVQAGDGSMVVNDFSSKIIYLDPITNSYMTFG